MSPFIPSLNPIVYPSAETLARQGALEAALKQIREAHSQGTVAQVDAMRRA